MNTYSSVSGESRKRMSSLILSFFCFTNSSGRPSEVEPGSGTLIRYSFAIGLKICWTRSRSVDPSSARTVSTSVCVTAMSRWYVDRVGL